MLLYLGHPDVRILDGGFRAWTGSRGATATSRSVAASGQFTVSVRPGLRAMLAEVARAVGVDAPAPDAPATGAVVLDVRPRDEWDGARHYFEPRTGHIPGAVRLDWRELLDSAGRRRSPTELLPLLAARGLRPERPVIVYCTGGVRSAEAFWMLRSLGFRDVRNFDGSWYEWAFDKRKPVAVGGADVP